MLIGAISDYLKSWRTGVNYAYLNFKDHPRGCEMLEHLIANGYPPSLVIEELCDAGIAGTQEQNDVLHLLPDYRAGETAQQLCLRDNIPYRIVSNLNDEDCLELIRTSGIDLIILGDVDEIPRPETLAALRALMVPDAERQAASAPRRALGCCREVRQRRLAHLPAHLPFVAG